MIKPSQTSERASPAPESNHAILCKQKTADVSLRRRFFYGRRWITQAAHLKKPRRGFFPRRTIRRVDAVRIHPHENPNLLQTENRQRISTLTVFLWARVDYASRAAKNSPLGCFCAVFCDSAAAVRIHPHENPNLLQTENRQRISTLTVFLWARVDSNHRS